MTKMLTLFGEDIDKLGYNDLKRERQMQRFLFVRLSKFLDMETYKYEHADKPSNVSKDKIAFLGIYVTHLQSLIDEIDYWLDRRVEPEENWRKNVKRRWQIREENRIKRRTYVVENNNLHRQERASERDVFLVSWDKEKFLSIAADRGYQTEGALIQDVGETLNLDRMRTKSLLDNGRFTWGQVLCLGAMFQVTPKEFCDTFLAGYFVDNHGEYRADFDNISRMELLRPPIRPMPMAAEEEPEAEEEEPEAVEEDAEMIEDLIPLEVVEVGSDGRPLDEEVWFD